MKIYLEIQEYITVYCFLLFDFIFTVKCRLYGYLKFYSFYSKGEHTPNCETTATNQIFCSFPSEIREKLLHSFICWGGLHSFSFLNLSVTNVTLVSSKFFLFQAKFIVSNLDRINRCDCTVNCC